MMNRASSVLTRGSKNSLFMDSISSCDSGAIGSFDLIAQPLPHRMTKAEKQAMPFYLQSRAAASQGITTPPVNVVRTMAEWEELQGILVTWTSYNSMLREIIRAVVGFVGSGDGGRVGEYHTVGHLQRLQYAGIIGIVEIFGLRSQA